MADDSGTMLETGSGFDEVSEMSWTAASVLLDAAECRKHLLAAMHHAGLTKLPSDWWNIYTEIGFGPGSHSSLTPYMVR